MRRWLFFGSVGYRANAVRFDGSNDYLSLGSDFTGNADAKVGLASFWVNFTGGDGVLQQFYYSADGYLVIRRFTDNAFQISGSSAAGAEILLMTSTSAWTVSDGWTHVLMAWDLNSAVGQMYINNADDRAGGPTLTNANIDYTRATHHVGSNNAGNNKITADVADFYLNLSQTLDISVEANRRKFISVAGKPVYLGADGSLPTGTSPTVFLSSDTDTWHTNKGTGDGFTENGALTDAPTSPSG